MTVLPRNAVAVLGALRFADEHALSIAELAPRVRLGKRAVARGLRDLHDRGLVMRLPGTPPLWRCVPEGS